MTSLKQFVSELATKVYDEFGTFNSRLPAIADVPKLGKGASRSVYQFEFEGKTIAVKVAINNLRRIENRREWKLYYMLPANVQALMAKPLAISTCGRVIAFEFIPTTLARSDNLLEGMHYQDMREEFNQNLQTQLQTFFVDDPKQIRWVMCDNHANNIGLKENGDMAWIDYAIEWWDSYPY